MYQIVVAVAAVASAFLHHIQWSLLGLLQMSHSDTGALFP